MKLLNECCFTPEVKVCVEATGAALYYMFILFLSCCCTADCSFEAEDTSRDEAKEPSNVKRHSEGTFSNDYSKYLEDRKAQDFVWWLMNNKRSGSVWDQSSSGWRNEGFRV